MYDYDSTSRTVIIQMPTQQGEVDLVAAQTVDRQGSIVQDLNFIAMLICRRFFGTNMVSLEMQV